MGRRLTAADVALIKRELSAAIFSGSPRQPELLVDLLRERGLSRIQLRAQLVQGDSLAYPDLFATAGRHPVWQMSTHRGIRWLFTDGRPPPVEGVAGEAVVCSNQHLFVRSLQAAVQTLRNEECRRLDISSTMPEVETVRAARRALVSRLISYPGDVQALATTFIDLSIQRYRGYLNDLRRRLIEAIALATALDESRPQVPNRFARALTDLADCWSLTDLRRVAIAVFVDLAQAFTAPGTGDANLSPLVRQAASLAADPGNHQSVAEIAQALHVSAAHLSRRFRAETGRSLISCVQDARIERAKELLLRDEVTILEVGLDSGFGSAEQFHRCFKRCVGVTPAAYRRATRAG